LKWNQADSTWVKVGEVVDAIGQGRKQLYNGKEYDYVFDVDIEDGKPPLKLPYNLSGNNEFIPQCVRGLIKSRQCLHCGSEVSE
jgi:phospholipase A-2-activating protein